MSQENQTPNLLDLAIQAEMAQQAYEYDLNKIEALKNNPIGGVWRYESNTLDAKFSDLGISSNGYFAVVYRNIQTNEIIISSRGTNASNLIGVDQFNDITNDVVLAFDKNPTQLTDALIFAKKVADDNQIEMSAINYNGHSLGGFLAIMSGILSGSSSAIGFNPPGVAEVAEYLRSNPDVLEYIFSINDYLNSDPTLLSKFQTNLNNINTNNITNVNAVGDGVSDINSQIGNVIELPVSASGTAFLIGLIAGGTSANPIVGVSVLLGASAYVEKHSIDTMVNSLKQINSGNEIDVSKLDGTIFSVKYADGTQQNVLLISPDKLMALEGKYGFETSDNDLLGQNGEMLLIKADGIASIDGENYEIGKLVQLQYNELNNISDFITRTVDTINKPFLAIYNDPQLISEIQGEFLARIILGDSIDKIASDLAAKFAATIVVNNGSDILSAITGVNVSDNNSNNVSTKEFIAGSLKAGLITFGTLVASKAAQGDSLNSEEYAKAAINATASAAANQIDFVNFGFKQPTPVDSAGNPINGADGQLSVNGLANAGISAAIINFTVSLSNNGSMNSEEYEVAAKQAMVSATIAVITTVAVTTIMSALPVLGTAAGYVVGSALGIIIGTVVSKLGGVAIYNYFDTSFDSYREMYDVYEDLLLKGEVLSGSGIEDNLKQLASALEDLAKAATIDFVKDLGRSILDTFFGGYGKTYGVGEYPDPYSFIKVIPKADGSGNQIFGLEREGAVLIASQNGNDDIYGTAGQDIMIGKAGKNTILGYGGNDYIEGRSNDDILIGGRGDDIISKIIVNDNFKVDNFKSDIFKTDFNFKTNLNLKTVLN